MNDIETPFALLCSRLILYYLIFQVLRLIYWTYKQRSFRIVEGKVIQNGIKRIKRHKQSFSLGRTTCFYRELLQYEYFVDGERFVSGAISVADQTTLKFNSGLRSQGNAEYWQKWYPVGKAVSIYYDPKNPQRAFLYTTIIDKNVVLMFVLMGILYVFLRLLTVVS